MKVKSLYDSLNSIEDLQALIDNCVRESELLEYKRAKDKFTETNRNEISKDVSAMANSNGGVIIYGIETGDSDKTTPVALSGIWNSNIETFDRVVNSQIKREVKGIQKKVIGDNVKYMIIMIPQSDETPHQSLVDKKYYRRALSESIPMEHDIIELHFGKRHSPVLNLEMEFIGDRKIEYNEEGFSKPLNVRISINNSGKKIAKYISALLFFPNNTKIKINSKNRKFENIDNLYSSTGKQARQYIDNTGVIHPELTNGIATISVELSKNWFEEDRATEAFIEWFIFADNMEKKSGNLFIQ